MAPDQPAADRPSITELLLQVRGGDPEAMNHLFPLVYGELRRLAHWQLQHERTGHTLDTGALVHETYLKIVDQPRVHWRDRAHFFRVASWAMRRILVDTPAVTGPCAVVGEYPHSHWRTSSQSRSKATGWSRSMKHWSASRR